MHHVRAFTIAMIIFLLITAIGEWARIIDNLI